MELDVYRLGISRNSYTNGSYQSVLFTLFNIIDINEIAMIVGGSIPNEITELYGQHDFTFRGEHMNRNWGFEYKKIKFLVVSANGRGTTVEAEIENFQPNNGELTTIKEFVEMLISDIKSLQNDRILMYEDMIREKNISEDMKPMKKIKRFDEFRLLREAEGDEEEFNFDDESTEDEETDDEMSGDGSDFDFGDDMAGDEESTDSEGEAEFGGEDQGDEMEEEEEEEVEDMSTYNEDPSTYVEEQLKRLENRLVKLFENPQKPDDEKRMDDKDPSAYYNQGVELLDMKTTDMPENKSLIVKYHDSEFLYHLIVTVNIKEGIAEKPEDEMDTDQVEECGVKFKKYDMEDNLLGELERKKIKISDIDQDYLDTLNGNLDSKYSVDNNFEIEYDEDGSEKEENTDEDEDKEV